MPQQRAFAQKLKPRNSDLRRQVVSSTSFKGVDIAASFSRVSLAGNLPLYDVIDPVDFEECVNQGKTRSYESTAYCNWSIRQFSDFPADDVELKVIPREIVYKDSPIHLDDSNKLAIHVKDVLCSYSADFVTVNRRYEQFSTGEIYPRRCAESLGILQSLSRQIFEADLDEAYDTSSHRASLASGHSNDSTTGSGNGCGGGIVAMARDSCSNYGADLQQCMVDPVIPGIVERLSLNQMDTINAAKREKNRQAQLFSIYSAQHEDDVIEKRLVPQLPSEWKGHRLFLKIISLKMELDIEPIFASAALYDAKEKKKVSENFYFDCNSDTLKGLLKYHIPFQDVSSLCNSAVFSVTHASADLFLVFRLEKVLQAGDLAEVVEPYLKDERNKDKLKTNALEFCDRLGAYRMPFAWTAVDLSKIITAASEGPPSVENIHQSHSGSLLDAATGHSDNDSINSTDTFDRNSHSSLNGTLKRSDQSFIRNSSFRLSNRPPGRVEFFEIDKFKPLTLTVNNFFRQETEKLSDEDLYKYLSEVRKPSSLAKKLKCIPGTLKFDISPYFEDTPNCLSPELLRTVTFHDEDQTMTKEILEFPAKEIYIPNYGYRNLLYLYPKCVNFSSKPGSSRNIAIRIQLMQGQENPLQVIYGKSSCPAKQHDYLTTVTYHSKNPQFYDEIKLDLPLDLNDTHHLLFTFYHISCKPKIGPESLTLESLIGYSWLPLYTNKQLPSGEYNLPVLLDQLPACYFYLPPEVNLPNVKWLDNHKPLFNIEIKAITTVYTQDKHLDTFLSAYHSVKSGNPADLLVTLNETEMQKIIRNLTKARPEPLVNFLYVILDKLFDLMLSSPSTAHNVIMNLGQTCFEMLGQIAKILTYLVDGFCDQHNRSSLLTTYIHYWKISQQVDGSGLDSFASIPRNQNLSSNQSENSDLFDIIRGFEKNLLRAGSDLMSSNFRASKKLLHEELALQWVVSSGAAREMACGNAWFFFELIIKAMGEYLLIPKPNKVYLKRKLRFSQQFVDDITTLITTLTSEVISRCGKDMRFVQNLNCSLAFFLRDALSLMDRTYVFGLIRSYCKQMMAKVNTLPESDSLLLLKMECLRIICSHEHFVTLNLPFTSGSLPLAQQPIGFVAQPPSPSPSLSSRSSGGSVTVSSTASANSLGAAELTTEFRSNHFLVGLVLSDLANALELRNRLLQNKAINILRNLLSVHDFDSRLSDKFVKAKVASLYFPLLGIVMDANGQLFDPYAHRTKSGSHGFGGTHMLINYDDHAYEGGIPEDLGVTDRVAAGSSDLQRRSLLTFDDTRNLLICFCWVIKNSDRGSLRHWLAELSQLRLTQLLDVLQLCISCFEYKGRGVRSEKASRISLKDLKSAILGYNSARMDILNRHKANKEPDGNSDSNTTNSTVTGVRWRKEHYNRQSVDSSVFPNLTDKIIRYENENDPISEGNLSTEINTIVLDTLEMIVKLGGSSGSGCGSADNSGLTVTTNSVINLVIRVVLHMLACNQSVTTCQHLFATQRAIVAKWPDLLFEEETEQCSDLCLQLLHHCAGRLQPIRAQAAASLYLLLRQGFESGSNFARVKMQITVSLSSLVGTAAEGEWFNEENLRWSLKTVLSYAEADSIHPDIADTTFCDQVKDLVFNLHMILSDTVKMKEFQNDFEMLVDLMYRIAKGYQNSPDLRLTWLQSLAQKHYERGNYAEAGHCYVHAAALAAEYMHMMEDLEHLPRGAVTFLDISDNVLEESAVSDDIVSPDEEGICVSMHFTEPGLSMLLEHAAAMFRQAQMFEAVHWTYKILLLIHEHKKNYQKISSIYSILAECLAKIDTKSTIADKRLFGTYFRVGFYGSRFGDLDGQEFVYREPSITKLPEISHRLESFYAERFGGSSSVMVIKDSNNVDRNSLDANKVYLQITYVEPYFDLWELRRRTTHFEQNYNVNRFVYSTPFTLDGRAHGDLKDQYKRKTILTTAHSFPYVKTRVRVVGKEQRTFTPIEVAIEDVRKKTKELAAATNQEPRDPKMLQMVLQGCIGTTVNQGPLEIANVFLADAVDGRKPMDKLQNKLRLSFKDFSKKCADALRENKRLIGPDQKEYQKELERNYIRFTEQLAPMVSVFLTATMKRNHHHYHHSVQQQHSQGGNMLHGGSEAPLAATEYLPIDDDSAPVSAV